MDLDRHWIIGEWDRKNPDDYTEDRRTEGHWSVSGPSEYLESQEWAW